MRAHFVGHRARGRADRTSPPAHRRASRAAWRCATCRSPRWRRSAPGRRRRLRPRRSASSRFSTASCASSPSARTRMWRVPPNSEVERASSPSRTGSERRSAPDSSIRSPGSGSIAASLSAAAAAPASSGPQKKAIRACCAARGATGGEVALGRLHAALAQRAAREPGDDPVGDLARRGSRARSARRRWWRIRTRPRRCRRPSRRWRRPRCARSRGRPAGSARAACAARGRSSRRSAGRGLRARRRAARRAGSAASPALPLCASRSLQRVAHQPAGAALDRRDLDRGEALRDRAAAAAGIHRLQPAARRAQRAARGQRGASALHATMLTSRSGTTITLRTCAPSSERWTFSLASASASSSSLRQALGDGQRVAQLALDLHRDGHLVLDQQRRIDRGPGGVGDQAGLAHRRPAFLGEVRHHRRGEQQQRADRRAAVGRRRGLLGRGGQLVDPRHRLVEGERLDVLGRPRRSSGGSCGRAPCPRPCAPASYCAEQPPQPLDEAAAAFDARFPTTAGRARAGCRTA